MLTKTRHSTTHQDTARSGGVLYGSACVSANARDAACGVAEGQSGHRCPNPPDVDRATPPRSEPLVVSGDSGVPSLEACNKVKVKVKVDLCDLCYC